MCRQSWWNQRKARGRAAHFLFWLVTNICWPRNGCEIVFFRVVPRRITLVFFGGSIIIDINWSTLTLVNLIILVVLTEFETILSRNTPGTAGGPGGCDRTLAVKSRKNARKSVFFCKKIKITITFLHISSSYAKILGETNFHAREIPRSGWKAEGVERKKRKNKVGENNGQLRFVLDK